MKTITEHLQSLPEPYSTLALRRVVKGQEQDKFTTAASALSGAFLWSGREKEEKFWTDVHQAIGGSEKTFPEIPDFLRAELEPEPAPAPECVFEVGKIYQTREGLKRRVVHINPSGERPVISLRTDADGNCVDASTKHRLDGKYLADGTNSPLDLIPPALPKRVACLGPEDVPPGSVIRRPESGDADWTTLLASGSRGVYYTGTSGVIHKSFEDLKSRGNMILRPGSTVWQKCEKTVDA